MMQPAIGVHTVTGKELNATLKLTHLCEPEEADGIVQNGYQIRNIWKDTTWAVKPYGIFLSVNGEWEDWCKSEQFDLNSNHSMTCRLRDDARICVIRNESDWDNLLRQHAPFIDATPHKYKDMLVGLRSSDKIDLTWFTFNGQKFWRNVMCNYDGIYMTGGIVHNCHLSRVEINPWDVATVVMFGYRQVTFSYGTEQKKVIVDCDVCNGTGDALPILKKEREGLFDIPLEESWKALNKLQGGCYRCNGKGKVPQWV